MRDPRRTLRVRRCPERGRRGQEAQLHHHAHIVAVGPVLDDEAIAQGEPVDVLHGVALPGGLDTDEQAAVHGEAPDAQMRARSRESNDHLIAERSRTHLA